MQFYKSIKSLRVVAYSAPPQNFSKLCDWILINSRRQVNQSATRDLDTWVFPRLAPARDVFAAFSHWLALLVLLWLATVMRFYDTQVKAHFRIVI